MAKTIHLSAVIPVDLADRRLDQALAILFSEHSRSRLQNWIRDGVVHVDNQIASQRQRVKGGEQIEINATFEPQQDWSAENIPLQVMHEDKELLIINKPAGLIVHPGAGNPEHTLLNALLHYDSALEQVPRAGIIQRLDKDTSGLMVIARTPETHTCLVAQLQARKIHREYQAIVSGIMTAGGMIDQPIGRHTRKRIQMAVIENGKPAITHYRIIKKYRAHTHIRVILETGRTHQIRVHMAYIKHPVVGDPVYSGRAHLPKGISQLLRNLLQTFPRQALHACAISLLHPATNKQLHCEVCLPEDMQNLLNSLEKDANESH
jgi:23S rRNA pseudouridine1911/1915/1917 synthase